ncbi:response regulator transcription factor [Clostridium sediminicola]|uniref:response regulator n=1 Tax=Clostridium sediminicola TaxID=3114879 RepID=UPI0031F217A5
MSKIKIVIVDDMKNIVDYFKMILNNEPDMEVIGTANSGIEGVKVVKEQKPDVVLMDIQMESRMAGIEAIKLIKEELANVKIIVLTIHQEDELLFAAYSSGAMDYIVKTSSVVKILQSIRNVYNNQLSLRPDIAEKILGEFTRLRNAQSSLIETLNIVSKLTNSEFEILKAVYNGCKYKQIAKQRYVEEITIRGQVNKILKKFQEKKMKDVVKKLKQLNFFDIYYND